MAKTRVGVVLREKIGTKTNSRSEDLVSLVEHYNQWCKRTRSMIQTLEKHHAAMKQLEQTRTMVAKELASQSQNSPLWPATGLMPSADRPASTVCSISSIQDTLSAKSKNYATKYKQFVIDYALEWEKVVRTRVDSGIKTAEQLRRDLDHYRKKVEDMRNTTNRTMTKGKAIKPEQQEKLKRNEEKLIQARESYNKVATDLCILIEEVTERSWRDLHPLLVKIAQFDMTLAQDESQILSSLNQVVSKLKEIGDAQGISAQPRLKDVAEVKPELLSTRPGGVHTATFQIEANVSPSAMSNVSHSPGGGFDDMAQPPGTVAPQGIGGFPVQLADSAMGGPRSSPLAHRNNSFSSHHSEPPTTLGMLAIGNNAAPAPTMDDVYNSQSLGDNGSVASFGAQSAPIGALPPLGENNNNVYGYPGRTSGFSAGTGYGRSNSLTIGLESDNISTLSFGSAAYGAPTPPPPTQPPPPPPSMPPPPPPGGGMLVPTVSPTSAYAGYGSSSGGPPPLYPPPPSSGGYGPPPSYGAPPTSYGGPPPNPFDAPSSNYGPPPVPTSTNPNNPFG